MFQTARTVLCLAALSVSLAQSAGRSSQPLAAWVESQGGSVLTGPDSRVVAVSFARTWASDADILQIADWKDLERLDLSLTYFSDRGAEHLKDFPRLKDLNLFAAEFITDAALSYLRANRGLERLNLRGTDITDAGLAYLAELTNLRSLDVSFTQISDVGLEHLAELTKLEELNLGGTKISGVGLNVLKLLPNLKKLSLSGIQRRNAAYCWTPVVTDLELETLAQLTELEDLNIGWGAGLGVPRPPEAGTPAPEAECRLVGGARVTDLGLAKLTALKKLRRLNLSGSLVTAAGLAHLKDLPVLEALSLWNSREVDDQAAGSLAGLSNLKSLDLSNTGTGDKLLAGLASLPKLRRLYLSGTAVTPGGLEAFEKRRPACLVSVATRPEPKAASSGGGAR